MNNSPEIENFAYSLRRYYVDRFYTENMARIPKESIVLDLGGTKISKRGRFDIEKYHLNVKYLNLTSFKRPDVQANAENIPFKNSVFDIIICSELLEHVPNPPSVLMESYRALQNGGLLLICVPFLYRVHADPYDYGRYTDYYWKTVLHQIGFSEIDIQPQGGFFAVMMDSIKIYMNKIGCHEPLAKFKTKLIIRLLTWMWGREKNPIYQEHPILKSFTTGYGIVAKK
jgi:SAM-dependent methyltransferase